MAGMRMLVSCLLILAVGFATAQQMTIVSPAKGAVLSPGQKTDFELHFTSTTSSVKTVAVTLGFKSLKDNAPKESVGHVLKTIYASDLHIDPKTLSYKFSTILPEAKDFTAGVSSTPYDLVLSQYLLLGATQSPMLYSNSTEVTVKK
ncbi:hypothetical protein PGT21_023880 [Puccinia graminis f. sp. tritici]|uniref:Dolichyl-diphosphooligosaccharide--protein glycosyltransferase subunit 2 n=1 Tax=Puccinia graminis f. sp. tritici TaxID=56615 RepID=A0A5B0RFK6_PUCGR|nr:hypothetical protein PGT21_023880 [Puccinia graminis f. sp. tritici]KAA1124018.1 hypothetical protein PGTUg99_020273 [Puccinia graminis f. sp. tritici]